jgi:hypothetical protein
MFAIFYLLAAALYALLWLAIGLISLMVWIFLSLVSLAVAIASRSAPRPVAFRSPALRAPRQSRASSAPSPAPVSAAASIADWRDGRGGAAAHTLSIYLEELVSLLRVPESQRIPDQWMSRLRALSSDLVTAAKTAQQAPPPPAPVVRALWDRCVLTSVRGADHLRSGLLCAANGVVGEGIGELVSAAAAMGRLSDWVPGTDWHPSDGAATLIPPG